MTRAAIWCWMAVVLSGTGPPGHAAPGVDPLPQAVAPASHRVPHTPRHRRYLASHRARHAHVPPPPAAAGLQVPAEMPAPVPDLDREPPPDTAPAVTALSGGTLQMHYPHVGDGYVPGSSPAVLDDAHTPKVPGMTVTVPLTQTPPSSPP
jgi:hypothetical protein